MMTALDICIDENLNFDIHIFNICLKACSQISALQPLTGLLDLPSRRAITTALFRHILIIVQLCGFSQLRLVYLNCQKYKNEFVVLF